RMKRSGAGTPRSKRWSAGGGRSGPCSFSGPRSPPRWYGSDWCSAATFPLRYGSPRASASRTGAPVVSAIGVGVDLVEVARVSAILNDKGSRVLERLLTPAERAYCESRPDVATHVAVRLAAKEAVYKALQGSQAARGIGWRDIEVTRAPDGRPDVSLSGSATARARALGVQRVLRARRHGARVARAHGGPYPSARLRRGASQRPGGTDRRRDGRGARSVSGPAAVTGPWSSGVSRSVPGLSRSGRPRRRLEGETARGAAAREPRRPTPDAWRVARRRL